MTAVKEPPPEAGSDVVQVKVWDFPVRILHRTLVACIIVLSLTGFYIVDPFFGSSSPSGFTMGIVRLVHITAGWIFVTVLVARVYWAFAGNRWARWDQFLPIRRDRRRLIRPSIEWYLFRRLKAPPVTGHNPLAGATYLLLFGMFALEAVTGFALEALANPHGIMWDLTGWVYSVLPIPEVRLLHVLIMWLTFGFIINHVYSSWLVDKQDRSGELSSIVTGWKTLPRHRVETQDPGQDPAQAPARHWRLPLRRARDGGRDEKVTHAGR